jgi:hypothetical protein
LFNRYTDLIKEHVLQEYEELLLVNTQLPSEQFEEVRLYRMHPYVKYVASKRVPAVAPYTDLRQRITLRNPHIVYTLAAHNDGPSAQIYFEYNL